jgi:hypothetical protein
MHQTPAMRDGDERPLNEEPLPDRMDDRADNRADTGFAEPEPYADAETRTEPDSLRDPFDEPEPMADRTTELKMAQAVAPQCWRAGLGFRL